MTTDDFDSILSELVSELVWDIDEDAPANEDEEISIQVIDDEEWWWIIWIM